jgi:hypothetical protein
MLEAAFPFMLFDTYMLMLKNDDGDTLDGTLKDETATP